MILDLVIKRLELKYKLGDISKPTFENIIEKYLYYKNVQEILTKKG